MFRADVLRFLPMEMTVATPEVPSAPTTGKRLVHTTDLANSGYGPSFTIRVPDTTTGATLIIVYRNASLPLRKIVFYDGVHVQPPATVADLNPVTSQVLRGFYQAGSLSAKLTHLLGKGPNVNTGAFSFESAPIGMLAPSGSARAWGSPTQDVTLASLPAAVSGFGQTATTAFTNSYADADPSSYDCPAWGGIIFRADVKDDDKDGLPDGIEDTPGSLTDADGTQLPDLKGMGAGSDQRDLFVEISAMKTVVTGPIDPDTGHRTDSVQYGNETYRYSESDPFVTDDNGHNHMPKPAVLQMLGDAYLAAPAQPGTTAGIRAHFDVGNPAVYHAIPGYEGREADGYLVSNASLARGGEIGVETACTPDPLASDTVAPRWLCQFPAFPGTVMWKEGFWVHREGFVHLDGSEFSSTTEQAEHCSRFPSDCRRRFDRNRRPFPRLLFAHATGIRSHLTGPRRGWGYGGGLGCWHAVGVWAGYFAQCRFLCSSEFFG